MSTFEINERWISKLKVKNSKYADKLTLELLLIDNWIVKLQIPQCFINVVSMLYRCCVNVVKML